MDTANSAVTENGLTPRQPGHLDNFTKTLFESSSSDLPESLGGEESTGTDSPLSEPRQDPTNPYLPEILITDYSHNKSGLDSTNLLDWSVSCNSVSTASSDLPQNVSCDKSDPESPGLTQTCANAELNVDENMSESEEGIISPPPPLPDIAPEEKERLESTSIDPASTSFATNSSSEADNHVTSINGVASTDDLLSLGGGGFVRESSEPPGGDSDEEYFEEFHLPNTHENAFVRHLSFRRKVQTTPIHAPDAERIEGLVRTGEFVRHGSIRKKILPEEHMKEPLPEQYEDVEEDLEIEGDKNDSSFSRRMERNIREIERYLSEDNLPDDSYEESVAREGPVNGISNLTTSTPKSASGSAVCRHPGGGDVKQDLCDPAEYYSKMDVSLDPEHNMEDTNIEESTIRKIQECLDFSAYKDILNLSGRLSDILSPKEVEEVLSHSERYRHYLDSEVIEALSLSFKGQSQSLPYTINTATSSQKNASAVDRLASSQGSSPITGQMAPNTDSGFSSPKCPKESKDAPIPSADDLLLVRRPSVPFDGIGAPGIFVESAAPSNTHLRKIPAPRINFNWSSDSKQDSTSDDESFHVESAEGEAVGSRKRIHVSSKAILNEPDAHHEFVTVASEATEHEDTTMHTAFSSVPTELPGDISPAPPPPDLIPEMTAAEEFSEMRHWRNVVIGGAWRRIDMKVIAPYRKCVSHGGYMEQSQSPIVVLSAALLPDRSRKDYHYVMDNLFMYVLSFLEQLVADNYVLVYFSEDLHQRSAPGFHWLRRAYHMIDRRLRKNLKALLLVHPSLWARTILTLSRPFVSSKFYRKLHFVRHLIELAQLVPLEQLEIPDIVKQADFEIMIREKKTGKTRR